MKKIMITIGIALMLSMIGCSQEPQYAVSDSTPVIKSQKEMVREEQSGGSAMCSAKKTHLHIQ